MKTTIQFDLSLLTVEAKRKLLGAMYLIEDQHYYKCPSVSKLINTLQEELRAYNTYEDSQEKKD